MVIRVVSEYKRAPYPEHYLPVSLTNRSYRVRDRYSGRHLQTNVDRQEIRAHGELDGNSRNAFSAAANCQPRAEPRPIRNATQAVAGYASLHREVNYSRSSLS